MEIILYIDNQVLITEPKSETWKQNLESKS